MYLLDSDYLINFLKGKDDDVLVIESLLTQGLCTSVICVGEVLEGLQGGGHAKRSRQFEIFIQNLNVFDIDQRIIRRFSTLRWTLRKKGKLIDNFDLLIASTCLAHNLTLLTHNTSHFSRIPKLSIFKG